MANIETTLIRSGIGTKDSNSALAAEVFATLDSTNGNSAQAKSLVAIIRRAEQRLAERLARKAARKGEQVGVTLTPEQAGDHAWPQASEDAERAEVFAAIAAAQDRGDLHAASAIALADAVAQGKRVRKQASEGDAPSRDSRSLPSDAKPRKVRAKVVRSQAATDAGIREHAMDVLTPPAGGFLARMRALAAEAEASGERV